MNRNSDVVVENDRCIFGLTFSKSVDPILMTQV